MTCRQARLVSRVISGANRKRIDAEIETLNLIQGKIQVDRKELSSLKNAHFLGKTYLLPGFKRSA